MPVVRLCHEDTTQRSSGHLYFIRPKGIGEAERNEIIMKLAELGVATNVHYKPLSALISLSKFGICTEDYPNSYAFYKNEITLPLYSKLTEEQVEYIIENTVKVLQDYVD